jgi:hypothetical protein
MNAESTLLNLKSRENKLSNQLFPIRMQLCLHFFSFSFKFKYEKSKFLNPIRYIILEPNHSVKNKTFNLFMLKLFT